MNAIEPITCPICGRLTPPEYVEKHHLDPKSKKGKETKKVCCSCGSMVHKLFTNKELAKKYNTIEALLAHPDIQKWKEWLSKRPNHFGVTMAHKKRR